MSGVSSAIEQSIYLDESCCKAEENKLMHKLRTLVYHRAMTQDHCYLLHH